MFMAELAPKALELVLDANANHVIQRCLQKFAAHHTQVHLPCSSDYYPCLLLSFCRRALRCLM